ncbi:Fe-S cluster assembly protein SufD [Sphingomonas naasensis]|uniref:SufD family Fe-S cluster assembly protein n=1 Tax=Sphingomonas naasensis TaxID=1344951 RepID=A0A4S1WBH9_9SPHN|nr:SufD family Fe-S cluster assembly protein [Sphingomonas naasensis]NIJ19971.1 Fe-S cluster assembly protein SufD [Sphingomonas naasensis]TGX37926.1 SufD family Fe-S cluster assembly protein [Sphingomonas naasensis]
MTILELPSPRLEEWRWADMATLKAAADAEPRDAGIRPADLFLDGDGPRLLFVDGVFEPAHSRPGPVKVARWAPETVHPLGGMAEGEGWVLSLEAEAAVTGIQIVHLGSGGESHVPARIALGEDAVATMVETYAGTGWANRFARFDLARGARLMRSVRLLQADGFVSLRDEAVIGEAASLVSIFLGAGGMGSRIDGALTLTGKGAFAEMGGALLTSGTQKQEAAVAVRHEAIEGTSRQLWRAVAANRSVASLAARVEVARGAQQTDGEQSLRGLLLERAATVNLKPELEIFADDVKCAHGATVGELDARALFYLQSRGIDEARAKALLTHAFVADALGRIGDDAVRAAFEADAARWLEAAL